MRKWRSFFRENNLWISLFLAMILLMILFMKLISVPFGEMSYGLFLLCFLFVCVTCIQAVRYENKIRRLKEVENGIAISLEDLPQVQNEVEQEYQKLLSILMEDKIRQLNELERKSKEFNEYFTLWVHQIKTPISAMRLLLQEKGQEVDLSEETEELFQMEQYVEMALHYMRLDSDTTDFVIRQTPLDAVIRNAIRKYAKIFIRRKIKLEYEGTNQQIITDEKWLSFIVEQILANALQYTKKGSIRICVKPEGIVVADTGIGICPEDLPRVFEKGYTGFNGHANRHSSGIGLYLCEKTAKKLKMEITIESRPGEGTKVSILFDRKKNGEKESV